MDAYIVNYEGRQGRHPMACVCKIHIGGYIGRAITEAVIIPMGKNYAMRISPQPLQKAPPITQDDTEFESEWEAHKEEINGLRKQVTDQMDEMDKQKRKIFALEKLLKLYLP